MNLLSQPTVASVACRCWHFDSWHWNSKLISWIFRKLNLINLTNCRSTVIYIHWTASLCCIFWNVFTLMMNFHQLNLSWHPTQANISGGFVKDSLKIHSYVIAYQCIKTLFIYILFLVQIKDVFSHYEWDLLHIDTYRHFLPSARICRRVLLSLLEKLSVRQEGGQVVLVGNIRVS